MAKISTLDKDIAVLRSELRALQDRMELLFQASDSALALVRADIERGIGTSLHISEELKKLQGTFWSRDLGEAALAKLAEKVQALETFRANCQGKLTVLAVVISVVINGVFVLGGILLKTK